MAARKAGGEPTAYKVVGAAAVIRKDKHERYVDHGAIILAEALDADNAKHLVKVGLIEAFELPTDSDDSE